MDRKNKILLLLTCAALIVAVLCGCYVWKQLHVRQEEQREFETLEEAVATQPPADESDADPSETVVYHDIEMLVGVNADCIGWLSIPGTAISYPVMHTPTEPQKYLHRDFSGAYSESGTLFLDYRCDTDGGNLIVYGHNMINGTMFGGLKRYLHDVAYLDAHAQIVLETGTGVQIYQIFAVAIVDKADEWYRFRSASAAEPYNDAVQRLVSQSRVYTGESSVYGERLLTLSTCAGVTERQRLIVVAKQII